MQFDIYLNVFYIILPSSIIQLFSIEIMNKRFYLPSIVVNQRAPVWRIEVF